MSFNQLKFSPCASWAVNATTFANLTTVGYPYSIFITTNNTIYVSATSRSQVLVWSGMSSTVTRNITIGLKRPRGIFATTNGDLYVDNGNNYSRIDLWTPNAIVGTFVMPVTISCYGVFLDINNTLYCSMDASDIVIKKSLTTILNVTEVAAGNGVPGAGPILLRSPNGIFVDTQLNLFVADCFNNRIQRFQAGQLTATTVAGYGAANTISLYRPTEVTLDANGYLFITDSSNHRIVASGPTGFRCIVGCIGQNGSQPFQLNTPRSMAFDSLGNIFVVDYLNGRLQKFSLASNSCGKSYHLLIRHTINVVPLNNKYIFLSLQRLPTMHPHSLLV